MMRFLHKGLVETNVSLIFELSTEKACKLYRVSRLVSPAPQMCFLTFRKFGFGSYVLSHQIETTMLSKLGFLVTISLTLNYVPTLDSRLVDTPR